MYIYVLVQGSVRGKADMYHQALGGGGSEKAAKPAPVSGNYYVKDEPTSFSPFISALIVSIFVVKCVIKSVEGSPNGNKHCSWSTMSFVGSQF